ncbi:MAG: type II toxin-antitoxin system RelE/ParE family toxin [Ornithinimicrobium sp.]|uniref:type II toxin-antitoxin system RelE/ParE family toxin n=1 Tax=Ornithinimicrobium sp. TaxID=1977084 RepID=UPI003D9B6FD3
MAAQRGRRGVRRPRRRPLARHRGRHVASASDPEADRGTVTYRVVFTPEAEDHLKDLYRYIVDAAAPQIAAGYVDKVITYGEGLAEFPHRGLARDDIRASLRITSYKKRTVVAFAVLTPPITICRQNWVRRSWTMPPGCADSPACCGADTTGHPPTPPEPCGRLRRTSSRPAVPQNRSTDRSPATPRIWSTECHRARPLSPPSARMAAPRTALHLRRNLGSVGRHR